MYVFPLWCFPVMARLRHSDVIIPLKKSQQPRMHREGNNALVSLFNVLLPGFREFSARILLPKPGTAKRKRCLYAAAAARSLQPCPTLRPHRRQPTRLPRPWDSPGKSAGVGCHGLLQGTSIDRVYCRKSHTHWYLTLQQKSLSWISIQMTILKQDVKLIGSEEDLAFSSVFLSEWVLHIESSYPYCAFSTKSFQLACTAAYHFYPNCVRCWLRSLEHWTNTRPAVELISPSVRLSPWGFWDCLLWSILAQCHLRQQNI